MIHIVSLALTLALPLTPASLTGAPQTHVAVPAAASASVGDVLAEMLGKAVVVWCRPSSLKHGITMLSSNWSKEDEFTTVTAKFRWYGYYSESPYTSTIRIDLFSSGSVRKVTAIGYKDDCLTPCKLCERLDDARDTLNEIIRSATD